MFSGFQKFPASPYPLNLGGEKIHLLNLEFGQICTPSNLGGMGFKKLLQKTPRPSYASLRFAFLVLQTRAPWTEVNLAQMTESCLAGVQKVFRPEGPRVSQKSLAPVQTRFAPVQPPVAPVQRAFCSRLRKDRLRPLQNTLGQIS